jgi:DNA-binding NarL/FixJ family response regulator
VIVDAGTLSSLRGRPHNARMPGDSKFKSGGTNPSGLRATKLPIGPSEVVVFSFPAEPAAPVDALTPSELEVARLVLAGHSNAEIARARGTSARTISKQLDSLYRKLGVHSRAELAVRMG